MTFDILHEVGVRDSSPDKVYDVLATIDGLAGWWASDTSGSTEPGGVIDFHFGPGDINMAVIEVVPGEKVLWEVVGGPEEWIGTTVSFDIHQDGEWTMLVFAHRGWREQVPFMHHCSTKWATFLMSLKSLVETGTGAPDPLDVKISSWN
ncbi:MAG: SRPBCC family protein [Marmoricola sp.]